MVVSFQIKMLVLQLRDGELVEISAGTGKGMGRTSISNVLFWKSRRKVKEYQTLA